MPFNTLLGILKFSKAGTLATTRPEINFIDGANITTTVADDSSNNRANVTIAATGLSFGESNTSSNAGLSGVGIVLPKVGVDLPFKAIDAGSNKISITDNAANKTVDINVVEANLSLGSMGGSIGTSQITNDAVTYAKIQNVSATDKVLGRSSSGAGDVEEIACTSAGRALLDDADASAQRTTLGLGSLATKSTIATGDIDNDAVTYAKIQNVSATDRLLGRDTAGAGDVEELTVGGGVEFTGSGGIQRSALTGDVTAPAGNNATTIASNAVTDAKLRDSAALSVIGRSANSTGDPADIAAGANERVLARRTDALSFVDWIGASNGRTVLAADYTITADDTWEDTGLNITLPASGTYLISYITSTIIQTSDIDGLIVARLYNQTDAAAVANSDLIIAYNTGTLANIPTATGQIIVTVAASKTIRLEAKRFSGVTWTQSIITSSSTYGYSSLTWVRIA